MSYLTFDNNQMINPEYILSKEILRSNYAVGHFFIKKINQRMDISFDKLLTL